MNADMRQSCCIIGVWPSYFSEGWVGSVICIGRNDEGEACSYRKAARPKTNAWQTGPWVSSGLPNKALCWNSQACMQAPDHGQS
jgi:hypothetical protein